jgi:type II secretory pathway pseudopilin PulG
MVVMLVVLVALGTIAGLTVISVQGGSAQASAHRFSAMALYAAESGGAAAMSWLDARYHPVRRFTNVLGEPPADVPGNGIQPGQNGNLLSSDQQGWYEVTLRNNPNDPGGDDSDTDGIIVIQVTGHGPNGAMRRIEWVVGKDGMPDAMAFVGWRDLF